jgi:hypothetical protein
MDEAAFGANLFGQPGQEGDDVVPRLGLDLVNAGEVGIGKGGHGGVALLADHLGGILGDRAVFRHGLAGERLDLEPDAVAVFRVTRWRP